MINLLPNGMKNDIQAARANVIIVRYMIIIMLAFLFIGATLYTSYTVLAMTKGSAEERIASNDENVQTSVYSETKQQVDALSTNLLQAKPILDSEAPYSRVLIKLGQLLPPGTILGETTINAGHFAGTPLEITAYAKSSAEATQLQTQLQAAAPFLTQVTVKKTEEDKGINGYPVSITFNAIISKEGL